MSPIKRRERATAKQRAGRGRHAQPGGPVYPLMRTPFAQLLVNPTMPGAEVPVELRSQEYDFPHVELPDERPLVSAVELRAALDDYDPLLSHELLARLADPDHEPVPLADDDTQPLEPVWRQVLHLSNDSLRPVCDPDCGQTVTLVFTEDEVTCPECLDLLARVPDHTVLDGVVVDDNPQAARHAGLTPAAAPHVPVPENPFLNAHPPRHAAAPVPAPIVAAVGGLVAEMRERGLPTEPISIHVGNALPARLTAPELMLLGRPIPTDAPATPSLPPAPAPYRPVRRDARHPLVFSAFDTEFWEYVERVARQTQAGPGGVEMSGDDRMAALLEHLDRVEAAHRAGIEHVAVDEYAGRLADASRPLPHRTPGAALAAIVTTRGQLVNA